MTKFSHKEASEQIASIYGIYIIKSDLLGNKYITKDLGALMELAIRNNFIIYCANTRVIIRFDSSLLEEDYIDHNNNPIEATRVAIAKALITKATHSLDQQTCSAIKKSGE